MTNSEVLIPIPGRLHSVATEGHVAGADEIYDDQLAKNQETLNADSAYLGNDEGQAVIPDFDPDTDTLHVKAQTLTTAKKDAAASNIFDKGASNGMGRVVLKATDDFKTVVESATGGNTIFVIQYDYTLSGNVTVPANCVLKFEGGSISGAYTLTGQNTGIQAELEKVFDSNVTLAGTWNVIGFFPEWFGAKGDGATDDTNAIQKVASLDTTMMLGSDKSYIVTDTIDISHSIFGNNSSIKVDERKTDYSSILWIHRDGYQITSPITIRDLYVVGYDNASTKLATGIIIDCPHVILDNVKTRMFNVGIIIKKWSISVMNCHSNFNNCNLVMYSSGLDGVNSIINDINVIGGNYSSPIGDYSVKVGDLSQPDIVAAINGTRILLQGFCFDGGSISIDRIDLITLDNLYGENPNSGMSNIRMATSYTEENRVRNVTIRNCYLRGGVQGIEIPNSLRGSNICVYNNTFQNILYCCVYSKDLSRIHYFDNYVINPSGYPYVHTGSRGDQNYNEPPKFYEIGEEKLRYGTPSGRVKPGTVFVDGTSLKIVTGQNAYMNVDANSVSITKTGTRSFTMSIEDIKKFNGGDYIRVNNSINGFIKYCDYPNNTVYLYGNDFPAGGTLANYPVTITTISPA